MNVLGDLLAYFSEKKYSFTSKIFVVLFAIVAIILINNILGFSFYYSNSQKISQLQTIENVKKDCRDPEVNNTLNSIEKRIIQRKNIIEIFFDLFSKDPLDKNTQIADNLIDTVFITKTDTLYIFRENISYNKKSKIPFNNLYIDTINQSQLPNDSLIVSLSEDTIIEILGDTNAVKKLPLAESNIQDKSRSQLWHTLSSSFAFILLFLILPIVPFTQKNFSWNMVLGMILFMFFDAGLIWLNQYLFGLIPLIYGQPWINYILNVIIHVLFLLIVSLASEKKKDINNTKTINK